MADDYSSSTSTTGSVSVGGSSAGSIETAGDTDWFKASLTAGRTYQIDVLGSPTSTGTLVDPYGSLRNASGTKVAEDDDGGSGLNSRFTYTATASGSYFVAAGSSTANGTGTYRVSITDVTVSAPADDYSSSTSTSGSVSVGGSSSGSIETAGDTDWFKTTLTAGRIYQIDVLGSPTSNGTLVDPYGSLRNASGTKVAEDDDGGTGLNTRFTYTATSGGTYFVAAGSSTANGTGSYRVSITDVTVSASTDDYAGAASTSGSVSVGGSSSGAIEAAGDTDWFKTTLAAGHTYRIEVLGNPTGNGTLADPYGSLRGASGSKVAEADDGGTGLNTRFNYTATTSGSFFVAAGSATSSGTGSYRVSITDVTVSAPTDDYGASTSTTGAVSAGGSSAGSIETAGDTDWFKTTLTAGHTYRIDVLGNASGNGTLPDPYGSLRNAAGTKVAEADDGGMGLNSRFSYTATASGSFFVAAGSATSSGTGSYRVSITDVTVSAPSDDFASATSTSGSVSVGGSSTGAIEVAGDTDWFKTTLTAGHTYRIDVLGNATGNGTLADPYGSLRNAAGTKVAEADDGGLGLDTRFTYTAATSGAFFVAAGSATSGGTGGYRVSVTDVTAPGPAPGAAGAILSNADSLDSLPYATPSTATATQALIVQVARDFVGHLWGEMDCTALSWAISYEAGVPFFGSAPLTADGHHVDPNAIVVPHAIGLTAYGPDYDRDAWTTLPATTDWVTVVQVGDIVRVYWSNDPTRPNTVEQTFDSGGHAQAHAFVVSRVENGTVWVIDNTTGPNILGGNTPLPSGVPEVVRVQEHSFNPSSSFGQHVLHPDVAYISRLSSAVTATAVDPAVATSVKTVLRVSKPTGETAVMADALSSALASGSKTAADVVSDIVHSAIGTTSVATLAYEFFTGRVPSTAGLDFLVSPTGSNSNNLNSAFYQSFSTENRYINFAVNLGKLGEGVQSFTQRYGALTLFEATRTAYLEIFGSTPTDTKIHQLLDSRVNYFSALGGDGSTGIGTKAAMVGWLLAEAAKAGVGDYALANEAFLKDLAAGLSEGLVHLIGVYGDPSFHYNGT